MHAPIRSVEEFYAHALAIEREAAERYGEFAAWFDSRGEDVLAGLCRELAGMEHAHFLELARASAHLALPDVHEAAYRWLPGGSPEVIAREDFMRAATPRDLLRTALHAECRAVDFFDWVARTTPDEGVRQLATSMGAEERQHVDWVMKAIEYRPATV
jgi:rubrerythrin